MITIYQMVGNAGNAQNTDQLSLILVKFVNHSPLMATSNAKLRTKKPLKVKLINASGQVIEGLILSGHLAKEDPGLAIAKELGNHKHLEPTPIP